MAEMNPKAGIAESETPDRRPPSLILLTVFEQGEGGRPGRIEQRVGSLFYRTARRFLESVQWSLEDESPRLMRQAVEMQQRIEQLQEQERNVRDRVGELQVQNAREEAALRGDVLAQEIKRLLDKRHLTKDAFKNALARYDRG